MSYFTVCGIPKWNFQVITSSPHYAQSNGLAERGDGIAKDMLKKNKDKFKPKVVKYHDKISKNKEKQKYWYDKSARKVFENFSEGQLPEPRSYLAKLQGGNILRRNVQWLKNRVNKNYEENTETDVENNVTEDENIQNNLVSNNTETDVENNLFEDENIQNNVVSNNTVTKKKG
ncbi:Retrotransposable element Tf2 protein type 1 [Aphis craccivora]|uniref:Retrotransposable element Tf2 protein type 1 n=1 Tax=Aphis craccivora TaxID=307492 RepID=A0A6G0YPK9_APHCR|nr:Retrotransposable element Tf2 protein type 1 [Aphis craccivora]